MRFNSALAVTAAIAGLLMAAQVMALPVGGSSQPIASAPALPVVQVHGCHFDMGPGMEPDRANGPHYNNRECNVVRVGPGGGYGAAPQARSAAPQPPRYDSRPRDYGNRGYRYDEAPRRGGYRGDDGFARGYGPPPRRQVCRERCRYVGPFKQCRTVCD